MDGHILLNKTIGSISDKYSEYINVSSLAKGQYFIQFYVDGDILIQKFVKQ
jgi:hypothetical protein